MYNKKNYNMHYRTYCKSIRTINILDVEIVCYNNAIYYVCYTDPRISFFRLELAQLCKFGGLVWPENFTILPLGINAILEAIAM